MNPERRRSNRLGRVVSPVLGQLGARLLRQRWFARAPISLFGAGVGWVFGSRLVMVEHTGRRTGLARRVILEVVDDPSPGTYLVSSGFGTRSQWLRNIEANPQVRIWVGRHRAIPAHARQLSSEETAEALAHYSKRHPYAWSVLVPVFEATLGGPVDDLPLVAIQIDQLNVAR
ncbi:MAG: nitroreductase family deazaflavin-dependent oxidoreductase [Actinomycetes bacterium]